VLQTGYAGEKPPREMLSRLAIQGYHDKTDGPDGLLLWVDVAFKAYDQLAQLHIAERLKTELLANVSHEFRTPLNIIVGYIDLLREGTFGACPADARAVFEKVLANAAYLLDLVEEFLDLSKLEAGAMHVKPERMALTPFLRELAESFALIVNQPVAFLCDVPEDLPVVIAEAAKLRVVIHNLLSNAAKFTREGRIQLTAASLPDGRAAIRVTDTGPGIPPDQHEAIFEIFHQLRPHDGETKGIGLGLALARRFTRMMGGDIAVESAPGPGRPSRRSPRPRWWRWTACPRRGPRTSTGPCANGPPGRSWSTPSSATARASSAASPRASSRGATRSSSSACTCSTGSCSRPSASACGRSAPGARPPGR